MIVYFDGLPLLLLHPQYVVCPLLSKKKVWTGVVTDPERAQDEAVPRTVSMTWGDVCNTEVGGLFKRVLFIVKQRPTGHLRTFQLQHVYAAQMSSIVCSLNYGKL